MAKFYMLTEEQLKESPKCCYGFFDKDLGEMVQCGKPARYSLGPNCKHPLCEEHGRFVGSLNTKGMDGKTWKEFDNGR
ncbi:MAG: hypothetical protein PVJ39_04670 [Gammaproteobacteria bacterium]|jgi:hypothetical protein